MTPRSARLALGVLVPLALLSAAAALSVGSEAVASVMGGPALSADEASARSSAEAEAHFAAIGARYAKESASESGSPASGSQRGRNARFDRTSPTFTTTANLIPGLDDGQVGATDTAFGALVGAGYRAPAGLAATSGLCPPDMASIDDRFCVDRYEASLLEVLPDGTERPFSPYESLHGQTVRAVSEPGVYPQGYISEVQAIQACGLSGKRLCKAKEWRQACMGPAKKTYGYADKSAPGKCNDHGISPMRALYANENLAERDKWDWTRMNRPELNQLEGTLAHTGEHDECTNGYGVYDMVGNLHEWVDDPNGTFQGGYYQDTTLNGEGCQYVTMAHEARYHDYSTGFRCCADVAQ